MAGSAIKFPKTYLLALVVATTGLLHFPAVRADVYLPDRATINIQSNSTQHQSTQRRVALVIGNSRYRSSGLLRNPYNDAVDMASALRELGFDVILATDANQRQMEDALTKFSNELYRGSVGVFYYAGHGVQANGENYLLPVDDENIRDERDLRDEALALGDVLYEMENAKNDVNIVILDACRNNPFSFSRSMQRGLAVVQDAAKGMFIAYATAPGDVAEDGRGQNGTFTGSLLRHIHSAELTLDQLFTRVRVDVMNATNEEQIPWTASSLTAEFSFSADLSTVEALPNNLPLPEGNTPGLSVREGNIQRLPTQPVCASTVC